MHFHFFKGIIPRKEARTYNPENTSDEERGESDYFQLREDFICEPVAKIHTKTQKLGVQRQSFFKILS